IKNGDIELRYSFLSAYFEVLLMLRGLLRSSLERSITRAFSRLIPDSEEARDLRRYFSNHMAEVDEALRSFIPQLRARAISQDTTKGSATEQENAKGAISSLLHLYFGMQKLSIDITTSKLLAIYGIPEDDFSTRTLEGLFIKGAFPPVDF